MGQGFPDSLPSLNTSLAFVFWNHVGFFIISLAITVIARDLVLGARYRGEARMG